MRFNVHKVYICISTCVVISNTVIPSIKNTPMVVEILAFKTFICGLSSPVKSRNYINENIINRTQFETMINKQVFLLRKFLYKA